MHNAFTILGGLAVFLFGLRTMSDGLQKLAGPRLRAILGGLTRNRVTGVFSGFLITCAVQSSSATTVLVVSFANAGLLGLTQAMGLVMGANIGTTLTAWLVSMLGFKFKITAFALPAIGIGFPLSFLDNARARHTSEALVGFGLLFLGLSFLKDGVPDLKSNPEALAFVQDLANYGFGSTILFVIGGTLLTVIVQSSSAASAITLTMVYKGWIHLDLAAAMVLGENIGTTITAQLASIGASRNAKRVANFHTLFNVAGVIWMLPIMGFVLGAIQEIVPGDAATSKLVATAQVAAFHTIFNVSNTCFLIGFLTHLERLVMWVTPLTKAEAADGTHLRFLETGLLGTPELATVEARRALQVMLGVCLDMMHKLQEVIGNPEQKLGNVVDEIKREEQRTDEMEEEIIAFCSQLARTGTSINVAQQVAVNLEMTNDIERIGDHCMNLVLLAQRRWEKRYTFTVSTQNTLKEMMEAVAEFLEETYKALAPDGQVRLAEVKLLENKINKLRNRSRKSHAQRMQDGEIGVREGLIFLDMMTNLEKIGDYCMNVNRDLDSLED